MTTIFKDKNGAVVNIGDSLVSDAQISVNIVSERYVEDLQQVVLFVQQEQDPLAFSYLTVDNLALQFTKLNVD